MSLYNEYAAREHNIHSVSELDLNVVYVIDSFQRKKSCFGEYYYCKGHRQDTEEKVNFRSSYYLKKELEIYTSKNLDRKFSFKVTKVRRNKDGFLVASVWPTY